MRARLLLLLSLVFLASCTPTGSTLSVDVLTDLVPGPEFDLVDVALFAPGTSRTMGSEVLRTVIHPAAFSDAMAFRRGLRAADFSAVRDGAYTVRVRLLRPPHGTGTVLVERWSSIVVRGSTRITVGLDAACVAVTCPAPGGSAAFTECAAGRCVDALCNPDDSTTWSEHCCDPMDPSANCAASAVLFCTTASECDAPSSVCSSITCARGYCLREPREGACGAGEYCARADSCEALPRRSDAGMHDSGMQNPGDAGTECAQVICEDATDPCYLHYIDCATGSCIRLTTREVGAACPTGICSNDQRCITCPGAPFCDATSDVDGDGIVDRRDIETCDGIDNDGDGVADDGISLVDSYLDRDGDAHGDTTTRALRCSSERSIVLRGGDCDDTDANISPDVSEVCNGLDDDCSGAPDDGPLALCDMNATCGTSCVCNLGYVGDGSTCSAAIYSRFDGRLKWSAPGSNDLFGWSLAVSGDGNTLAIGAPGENSASMGVGGAHDFGAPGSGAVFVYTRSGSEWVFQAFIKSTNTAENDAFGLSVALSDDGNVLAVGAPDEDGSSTGINGPRDSALPRSGAVEVYRRVGTTWSHEAYVKASNAGGGDSFGFSVDLNADGTTLVVGAIAESTSGALVNPVPDNAMVNSGAVYVFVRAGTTWSEQAFLKSNDPGEGDQLGYRVAVSDDGNVVAASAYWESSSTAGINPPTNDLLRWSGAAYVYVRAGTAWTLETSIKASNPGLEDMFGSGLALSGDGNTLAVGAVRESSSGAGVGSVPNEGAGWSGAVYVYRHAASTWAQEAFIKASNPDSGDNFGSGLALSRDGTVLAVGAESESSSGALINSAPDNGTFASGAVYLYTRLLAGWRVDSFIKADRATTRSFFGRAIEMSDAGTLMIGSPGEDSGEFESGAVYAFH